jgi:hypothetical protein
LLQLRAVMLHPTPNRSVVDVETAFLQQLLNIAQRERIAKIPSDRTKDDAGFGLPPFEDRRSGYHFAIVSCHQPVTPKVATHPLSLKDNKRLSEIWRGRTPKSVQGKAPRPGTASLDEAIASEGNGRLPVCVAATQLLSPSASDLCCRAMKQVTRLRA